MKQPVNKFRYTVINELGTVIATAFGESSLRKEFTLRDDGPFDYSQEMPGKVIFREAMFANLYSIEQTVTRCDFMTLQVDRNCEGQWVAWFSGRFSLNDAAWDLHRCEVEIKLDRYEDEGCLEDFKNQEINLFEFVPVEDRQTVRPYASDITIEKITYILGPTQVSNPLFIPEQDPYWGGAGTPEAGGWGYYYHYYARTFFFGQTKQTRWARQKVTLPVTDPAPGSEWVLISTASGNNLWAKPAAVFDCTVEEIINQGSVDYAYKKECKILGEEGTISQIDNGLRLADCLNAFVQKFCPGLIVKSEFFQINPDTVTNTNYVTGEDSKVKNIIVFQKSDVKRPAVTNNATKALVSWEKFINQIKEMFNAQWRVEFGAYLRVEHVSYFSKNNGLDLTLPKFASYVKGLNKYSYKTEAIPSREEFKFMEASAGDFTGLPIEYTGGCVSQPGRSNVINHAADITTTDIELILNNPGSDSNVVDDRGLAFVACDSSNLIISEPGVLTTFTRLNNSLAWAQLHRDYYRHYRPLKSGILNGVPTQFESVRPLKKGVTLTVPLCCEDKFFNPDDLVTTALGYGTVEKASYSFKDDTLSLDLLYPSDLNLYIPAIAVNDIVNVIKDVTTNLGVLANDIPSPAGPITAIEIITPPSHGSAVLIVGPAINYTPNPGYIGPDNLVYRVKDAANIPSNNALVAINVKSGIYARLLLIEIIYTDITDLCGGVSTVVGESQTATVRLEFFSDPAGTIPLDITAYGIDINYSITGIYGDPGNIPSPPQIFSVLGVGTIMDIYTDYEYFRNEEDCDGLLVDYFAENFELLPGYYDII